MTDEDSGKDDNITINYLPGKQLSAPTEICALGDIDVHESEINLLHNANDNVSDPDENIQDLKEDQTCSNHNQTQLAWKMTSACRI